MYEKYAHHEMMVWVRKDLKGNHRSHCLCYGCKRFLPGVPEDNCEIANLIYAANLATGVVTPVWECPDFSKS